MLIHPFVINKGIIKRTVSIMTKYELNLEPSLYQPQKTGERLFVTKHEKGVEIFPFQEHVQIRPEGMVADRT